MFHHQSSHLILHHHALTGYYSCFWMVWGLELHLSHSRGVQDDDNPLKMVLQSKPVPFLPSPIGASASRSTVGSGTFPKHWKEQMEDSWKHQSSEENISNFKQTKGGGAQEAICDGTRGQRCCLRSRYIHLKHHLDTYTQVCFPGRVWKVTR